MKMPDIYYDSAYVKLCERIEDGKATIISVNNEDGVICSPVILRKIPIDIGEDYYDLITPYGYGGPAILSLTGDKEKLIRSYENEMKLFAKKNNIVSEFIRFHPVIGNALEFETMYHPEWNRKTIGTNTKDFDIRDEFSKSALKSIRRALKVGITYSVVENPENIDEFQEIYYSTMDRDNADDFYMFPKSYFQQCVQELRQHIIYVKVQLEGKVIAAGLYFRYGDIIQCHLSGTLTEYLKYSPAYIIKYATALWAKDNGVHYIHYGGGTSKDNDNPLYLFKKKFGQNTEFDFYVGRKIWNEEVYQQLCDMVGVDKNVDYFPAYRIKK